MKAAVYHHFREPPVVQTVDDPAPDADGVVIEVRSTGLCLSDWHGWMGHDPDITVPHVPGHELAGIVVETGSKVTAWKVGDRVTLPFVCGCGNCVYCASGDPQICKHQFQPGFTHWGSFAQFVAIQYANQNLVRLPDSMAFETGSILGCRFATAFRAVVDQGQVQPGQWVAVHGCGGVGLSAIMIAKAYNAQVIALDLEASKLDMAAAIGADHTLIASPMHLVEAIKDLSVEGVHLGIDAVGHPQIVKHSIDSLRRGGRHVQVGLIDPEEQQIPVSFNALTAFELQLMGSHGIQASRYHSMFELIEQGKLHPEKLITNGVSLDAAPAELVNLDKKTDPGDYRHQPLFQMRSSIEAVYDKIGPKLARTPVKLSSPLGALLDCSVSFKMENEQITGSFKLRGVLSKFSELAHSGMVFEKVVAASTGNHALAVCHAARAYQVSPIIFVPENVSGSKLSKIKALGVEVYLKGTQSGETEQIAIAYARKNQIPLIHPYNDPAVIAGQGTIGLELHQQLKHLDQVFVPVGGGGLIAGIAAYLKEARPETKIIGVQPENASEMAESIAQGSIVAPSTRHTISDGTAGGLDPDTITYSYCKQLVDEFVLVEEIEIVKALKLIEVHLGLQVEPAAALALAGMLKNKQQLAGMSCTGIICGGNITPEQYQQVVSMKEY